MLELKSPKQPRWAKGAVTNPSALPKAATPPLQRRELPPRELTTDMVQGPTNTTCMMSVKFQFAFITSGFTASRVTTRAQRFLVASLSQFRHRPWSQPRDKPVARLARYLCPLQFS